MGFKENFICEHFGNNTTQTPNIDFAIVRNTQNYFRGAIVPRLDIKRRLIVEENSRTQINYFHSLIGIRLYHNVFRFEICMNNVQFMQLVKRDQELPCYDLDVSQVRKHVPMVLVRMQQVFFEQFSHQHQVLFVVKVVMQG
jgi:hypothetical protein